MSGSARFEDLAANLAAVRRRIEANGVESKSIAIVAVTKGQPLEACRAAFSLGLRMLGENRLQEALPKMAALPEAEWHMIGHLQSNKARRAAGRFALVHSLDSTKLAGLLPGQPALLEVNVSREPGKHGVAPAQALALAAEVAALVDLRGLMGMAALGTDPQPAFTRLRRLRDDAEQHLGRALPILSMGMSDDFEVAVRCGSTMLRLGRALFSTASGQ